MTTPTKIRRLPNRCDTFHLTASGYEDFWVELVVSGVPMFVYENLTSQKLSLIYEALAAITRSSNLVDIGGEDVDLTLVAAWKQMPAEVIKDVAALWIGAVKSPFPGTPPASSPRSPTEASSPATTP